MRGSLVRQTSIHPNLKKKNMIITRLNEIRRVTFYKNSIYFGLLVHFQEYNLYQRKLFSWKWTYSPKHIEFFSIFVERYLLTLLISLSYCECVPSSAITNIPFYHYKHSCIEKKNVYSPNKVIYLIILIHFIFSGKLNECSRSGFWPCRRETSLHSDQALGEDRVHALGQPFQLKDHAHHHPGHQPRGYSLRLDPEEDLLDGLVEQFNLRDEHGWNGFSYDR
jgi:hypothetical protein